MLDFFLELDTKIFLWINHDLENVVFDFIFPNITDLHKTFVFKFLILPLLLFLIVYRLRNKGFVYAFGLLLSLGFNDWFCGKLIKPFFHRPRPPNAGVDVILRSPHFGQYGFVSNHAANSFLMAMFLSGFFPKYKWWFFGLAFIIAFSRVYVGVHYPGDIFFGALIGMLFGYLGQRLTKKLITMWEQKSWNPKKNP